MDVRKNTKHHNTQPGRTHLLLKRERIKLKANQARGIFSGEHMCNIDKCIKYLCICICILGWIEKRFLFGIEMTSIITVLI